MKNTFLYKLYFFNTKLFLVIASFICFTLTTNLLGVEITPFFIWAMYSEKETDPTSYKVFKVEVNGSEVIDYTSGYTDNNRFFMLSPLSLYWEMKQNKGADPTRTFFSRKIPRLYPGIQRLLNGISNGPSELNNFLTWYARYLEQTTGKNIKHIKISVLAGHFSQVPALRADSSSAVIEWKRQ
jgi:hypothetical protein